MVRNEIGVVGTSFADVLNKLRIIKTKFET